MNVPDDPEGVIFHDSRTTDAPEEPLLHSALETDYGDFGRRLLLALSYQTLTLMR